MTHADRIHPEWQDLGVGDVIAFTPAGYPGGRSGPRVVQLAAGHHLVLDSSPGAPGGAVTGTWQFVLHEDRAGGTRLVFRTRSGPGRPAALRAVDRLLTPGYLVMNRAMLLGLKARAEGESQPAEGPAEGPRPGEGSHPVRAGARST
ncbi:hypothetical protein GCM10027517_10040 [Phycicoccus ginsengisoli]